MNALGAWEDKTEKDGKKNLNINQRLRRKEAILISNAHCHEKVTFQKFNLLLLLGHLRSHSIFHSKIEFRVKMF